MSAARDDEGSVRQLRRAEDDRHGWTITEEGSHAQNQVGARALLNNQLFWNIVEESVTSFGEVLLVW